MFKKLLHHKDYTNLFGNNDSFTGNSFSKWDSPYDNFGQSSIDFDPFDDIKPTGLGSKAYKKPSIPIPFGMYNTVKSTVCLYGVFDSKQASNILNNKIKTPIRLYEEPGIARKMYKGKPETGVLLEVLISTTAIGDVYDGLSIDSREHFKKLNMDKEEYLSKCDYTRRYSIDNRIIVYTINNPLLIMHAKTTWIH